ncbi:MAG TPA: UDP-N-acetylmuramoyl-L-alanine--D-glutamate ligase, partial [Clostridiales bacterium]|nr:UDP-N-acetylmuramoyl-L-alanine--D-glutamate ligase [Clostridiales bacterium]
LSTLSALTDPPILLIGGKGKGVPFDSLIPTILSSARAIVLFGETGEEIFSLLAADGRSDKPPILRAKSFRDAVRLAVREAKPGDTVLLSPASTSFDEFRNFEERGDIFREEVLALTKDLPDPMI